jgi:hypothetical protein
MLVPDKPLQQPSPMFMERPGAYPRVEPPKRASPKLASALTINILGWKGLPRLNTSLIQKFLNCEHNIFITLGNFE